VVEMRLVPLRRGQFGRPRWVSAASWDGSEMLGAVAHDERRRRVDGCVGVERLLLPLPPTPMEGSRGGVHRLWVQLCLLQCSWMLVCELLRS
jgi:hypothetical protein